MARSLFILTSIVVIVFTVGIFVTKAFALNLNLKYWLRNRYYKLLNGLG